RLSPVAVHAEVDERTEEREDQDHDDPERLGASGEVGVAEDADQRGDREDDCDHAQEPEAAREQSDRKCRGVDHAKSGERYARDWAYELRSSTTPRPTRNQPAKGIPPAGASTRTYISVVQGRKIKPRRGRNQPANALSTQGVKSQRNSSPSRGERTAISAKRQGISRTSSGRRRSRRGPDGPRRH